MDKHKDTTDKFREFLRRFREKLLNLDKEKTIILKYDDTTLEDLSLDNFKIFAKKEIDGVTIGITLRVDMWIIYIGSIYARSLYEFVVITEDHDLVDTLAELFYDLISGRIKTVLFLSDVKDPTPKSEKIIELPSIAQFYVSGKEGYELSCTQYPYIEGGFDVDSYRGKRRFTKTINTKRLKLIGLDSEKEQNNINKRVIAKLRQISYPFQPEGTPFQYKVNSIKEVMPINQFMEFRTPYEMVPLGQQGDSIKSLDSSFYIYFPKNNRLQAEDFIREVKECGYMVSLSSLKSGERAQWSVVVSKNLRDYNEIDSIEDYLQKIAEKYGGEYDGNEIEAR